VLPVLSEAMRWYDPELLEHIWQSVFPQPPTWLTYVCFLTFRCVLVLMLLSLL
jgi:hypothetical protein